MRKKYQIIEDNEVNEKRINILSSIT